MLFYELLNNTEQGHWMFVCAVMGALAAGVALFRERNPFFWFVAGYVVPIAFLFVAISPHGKLEREKLKNLGSHSDD